MMSVALARQQDAALALTAERRQVLRDMINPDLTDAEISVYLEYCQSRSFDPFGGYVAASRYFDKRANRHVLTLMTTIDGFRATAHRTGEMDGCDGPYWFNGTKWVDVWTSKEPPLASRFVVHRRGHSHPYTATVNYDDYVQTKLSGEPYGWWAKTGGAHMLGKCAEAAALRRAFPEELGSTYSVDEGAAMARHDAAPAPTTAEIVAEMEAIHATDAEIVEDEPRDYPGLIAAAKCEQDLLDLLPELRQLPRDEFREQLNREFNDRLKELRGAAR